VRQQEVDLGRPEVGERPVGPDRVVGQVDGAQQGPALRRVDVTSREIRSGPASSDSPPCKISVISPKPCARACSPIRRAVTSAVSADIARGWATPGLIRRPVHIAVITRQIAVSVHLDYELPKRGRPLAIAVRVHRSNGLRRKYNLRSFNCYHKRKSISISAVLMRKTAGLGSARGVFG
jgi:hypothetical protein